MKHVYILILLLFALQSLGQTASNVLKRTLKYHDPEGQWHTLQRTFFFRETRPEGNDRNASIIIDIPESYMKINRNEEEVYQIKDDVAVTLKGAGDQSRAIQLRNYYLYLWGLPMKLLDKDTDLHYERSEVLNGEKCDVLKAIYEADTWYFYFNGNGQMVQYSFFKNSDPKQGEVITLEDEINVDKIKIPKKRNWYLMPGNKYLGTDILDRID